MAGCQFDTGERVVEVEIETKAGDSAHVSIAHFTSMSPATKHRRFGSDDDIDVENQAPGGDIEVNEANDTGHAVDSDSASDDDAPPEIVSLEQGKEIEQARLEKGQELSELSRYRGVELFAYYARCNSSK